MAYLMRGRILIAQAPHGGATLLCVIFPTWVSVALIILIQVNCALAPRIPILNRFCRSAMCSEGTGPCLLPFPEKGDAGTP